MAAPLLRGSRSGSVEAQRFPREPSVPTVRIDGQLAQRYWGRWPEWLVVIRASLPPRLFS